MLAASAPTIRLRVERQLQGREHPIRVGHHFLVRIPQAAKAELAKHARVATQIWLAVMRITVQFDYQPFSGAK